MIDVAAVLEKLVPGADYFGSLTENTESQFNALIWNDQRIKPTWPEIIQENDNYCDECKLQFLANYRWEKEIEGIAVNGFLVPTDDRAKLLYNGAYARAKDQDPDGVRTFKLPSPYGFITLTNAQAVLIALAVADHVQFGFDAEAATAAEIELGLHSTEDDIKSAFNAHYASFKNA